jgi:hypothetical protein
MIEFKLYKSWLKGVGLVAISVLAITGGIWVISKYPSNTFDYRMGWGCIIFFSFCLTVGLFHLFDRRPQIIITENGIWDRTTNQDEVKWEQIKDAYPININTVKFVSLVIDDTFTYKQKQYKWAAKLTKDVGAQQFNLCLAQLKIDQKKFTSFITKMSQTEKAKRAEIIKSYFY